MAIGNLTLKMYQYLGQAVSLLSIVWHIARIITTVNGQDFIGKRLESPHFIHSLNSKQRWGQLNQSLEQQQNAQASEGRAKTVGFWKSAYALAVVQEG